MDLRVRRLRVAGMVVAHELWLWKNHPAPWSLWRSSWRVSSLNVARRSCFAVWAASAILRLRRDHGWSASEDCLERRATGSSPVCSWACKRCRHHLRSLEPVPRTSWAWSPRVFDATWRRCGCSQWGQGCARSTSRWWRGVELTLAVSRRPLSYDARCLTAPQACFSCTTTRAVTRLRVARTSASRCNFSARAGSWASSSMTTWWWEGVAGRAACTGGHEARFEHLP